MGTSEVVKVLSQEFSENVIEKFDKDEITTEKKLKEKLERFNDAKIDILVGTQMLAKGHDYHNVALSVILGIDSLLNIPDFRSRERAVSLCLQIAGRAGRSGKAEVFIQTQNRELFEPYLRDYELFLKEEMEFRKDLYPPFTRLLRVMSSHKNEKKAKEILDSIKELTCKYKNLEVVGFGKADVEKIAGKFRYGILLRSNDTKSLLRFAHEARAAQGEVDVDPLSFS
jgi:primosomal protein N' (replication factor Y)